MRALTKGQCIGLFLCISDVNNDLIDESNLLNREGYISIIIDGKTWQELLARRIALPEYMKYMVFHAKAKHISIQHDFEAVKNWVYCQESAVRNIGNICQELSSTFLRRHRLVRHDDIYVNRMIDDEFTLFCTNLTPIRLSKTVKKHVHQRTEFKSKRAVPKQFCIVRDMSGAGKTSLAVQVASERNKYFGIAKAALQDNADVLIDEINKADPETVLSALISADRPIVYTIDSLDEAINSPNKHREITSLVRGVYELNEFAEKEGLLCFPVVVLFTIREDFWREWESQFEGLPVKLYLKRFSFFTPDQTLQALDKYSKAYGYKLAGSLDKNSLKVLSHPFNILIYSEANEYRGSIKCHEVLDENVLELYFERKKEDILKRPIDGFTPHILMLILAFIAKTIAEGRKNIIGQDAFFNAIVSVSPNLQAYADIVMRSIVSEQILVRDSERVVSYRFRHMRFIEYLVSYHIAHELSITRRPQRLDELVSHLVRGDFLSLYYVHEFIRSICQSNFPEIYEMLTDFYAQSSEYMGRLVLHRRSDIAAGGKTTSIDLDTIDKATDAGDPNVCWDGFYVAAAKNNEQPPDKLVSFFLKAWNTNQNRSDRWKLLEKAAQHKLLLQSEVFKQLLCSEEPMDWYVFIDGIIDYEQIDDFKPIWNEAGGKALIQWLRSRGKQRLDPNK